MTLKLPVWPRAIVPPIGDAEIVGAEMIVSANDCVMLTPLLAVMVKANGDAEPLGAVPLSTPVVGSNVSHVGRPVAVNVGAGEPDAVTVKLAACVALNCAVAPLVKIGGTINGTTVRANVCVTGVPFVAVIVIARGEPVVSGAVPLRTPVVALSVSQAGRPVAVKVGAGLPVAATVNVPASVARNCAVATLVNTGAAMTVLRVAAFDVPSGVM